MRRDRSQQAGADSRYPVQAGQVPKRPPSVSVGDDRPRQGWTQVGNAQDLSKGGPVQVD
jgi:hypothetical protein